MFPRVEPRRAKLFVELEAEWECRAPVGFRALSPSGEPEPAGDPRVPEFSPPPASGSSM